MTFVRQVSPAPLLVLLTLVAAPSGVRAESNQTKPDAPIASQRVESINFDHWVVTFRDGAAGGARSCAANLRIFGSDGKQPVAGWQIATMAPTNSSAYFRSRPA